ncbi:MAG TPA: hypothetical protein VN886_02020 [Acidimicrobiales bacterium]|nr:hypothetical protein [Acidimicrobiales bacterium]
MLTKVMTEAIKDFGIALNKLHNDATTLSMQGGYPCCPDGEENRAPTVCFGHGKERPDLAQLVWLLTVSADGVVSINYRLADGNTSEDPTQIVWPWGSVTSSRTRPRPTRYPARRSAIASR